MPIAATSPGDEEDDEIRDLVTPSVVADEHADHHEDTTILSEDEADDSLPMIELPDILPGA